MPPAHTIHTVGLNFKWRSHSIMPGDLKEANFAAVFRSTLISAFGLATLYNLPLLAAVVSPTHEAIFHLAGPIRWLIVPVVFNILIRVFLISLFLRLAKYSRRIEAAVWMTLLGTTPGIAIRDISVLYGFHSSRVVNLALFAACSIAVLLLICLWTPARSSLYIRAERIGASVFGFAAIVGFVLIMQIFWLGWKARHLNDISSFTPPNTLALASHHSRVLWIVFDELSYDQVYSSRYPGLDLPSLDEFAQQSIVFSQVIPAGVHTQNVLPTLMSGVQDDLTLPSSDGRHLDLHVPATPTMAAHWQAFDSDKTVFAEAQMLGYHPAIAGWYNPYCRLLSKQVSSCFWTDDANRAFPANNLHDTLLYSIFSFVSKIPHFLFPYHVRAYDEAFAAQLHIDDYQQLYRAADKALTDPSLDFVFLHLPIPHPGGIYDRNHHVLTTGPSTYIDNLALVDVYVAHLHQTLQQQHAWDDTTILIMGDHSWRTQLIWKSEPGWSSEEQLASHGAQFDDRPFYALKLPNQQTPAQITAPFHATNTRLLLDALLRRQIQSPEQLLLWTQQHP